MPVSIYVKLADLRPPLLREMLFEETTLTFYQQHIMRTVLFLALCTVLLFQAGCGDKKNAGKPADLPDLYSVSITITSEGKPLEGANVTLSANTSSSNYVPMGTTNTSGIAAMQTYGYDGAPAGNFVVVVTKTGSENQKEVTDSEGIVTKAGGENYRYIDEKFSNKASTPFSITVTEKKGAKESFEVGPAVRVMIGKNE